MRRLVDALSLGMVGLLATMVLLVLTHPFEATAGEYFVGTIRTADAGVFNNWTGLAADGGFNITTPRKVSLVCDSDVYVCTDRTTCNSTIGVKVLSNVTFPTSIDNDISFSLVTIPADGGGIVRGNTGIVTCLPVSGATAQCSIFTRSGRE